MARHRILADPRVRAILDPLGDRVDVRVGGKHLQVRIDGRLVAVVSHSPACRHDYGSRQSFIAHLRRAIRSEGSR
jgi:hypothetical protein